MKKQRTKEIFSGLSQPETTSNPLGIWGGHASSKAHMNDSWRTNGCLHSGLFARKQVEIQSHWKKSLKKKRYSKNQNIHCICNKKGKIAINLRYLLILVKYKTSQILKARKKHKNTFSFLYWTFSKPCWAKSYPRHWINKINKKKKDK